VLNALFTKPAFVLAEESAGINFLAAHILSPLLIAA